MTANKRYSSCKFTNAGRAIFGTGKYHTRRFRDRQKVLCIVVFLRDAGERVRFFTVDGATDFFSKRGLENGVEIRATIEPDSQDVFLQVQQFRTLPYVAIPLYDACDGCGV